jgi:hypothetical protein
MKADIFYKVANNTGTTIHFIGFTLAEIEAFAFNISEEDSVDVNSVIVNFIP